MLCRLFLYDQESDLLVSRCISGPFSQPLCLPRSSGVAGFVFTTGESYFANDAYGDAHFNPTVDRQTKFSTRSLLAVPIRRGDNVAGCIELLNSGAEGCYSAEDLALVRRLLDRMAVGFTGAAVHRGIAAHSQAEADALTRVVRRDKAKHIAPVVRDLMSTVSTLLKAERCTLFLHDPIRRILWAFVGSGLDGARLEISDASGLAGACFSNNVVVNIRDAYADPRFNQQVDRGTGFKTTSILCAPIPHMLTGRPVGVVQVLNKLGSGAAQFTKADEQRIQSLCHMVSSTLLASEYVEDLIVSVFLNDVVERRLAEGTVMFDTSEKCVAVSSGAVDIFFLESENQWIGQKAEKLLGATNPQLLTALTDAQRSREEQDLVVLVYPYVGEAEGEVRVVRAMPFQVAGVIVGLLLILLPDNSRD
mmetsp:Transcript_938/g.2315  ORF Transcript_938/g.2315 Transcript_938/m.2315 type:complete len:420 (-) Transcript_938:291-1550(-)